MSRYPELDPNEAVPPALLAQLRAVLPGQKCWQGPSFCEGQW